MPMFDIEDSKDIDLENNKTSKETLAKIKGVEGLKAKGNEAGVNPEVQNSEEEIVELKPNFVGFGINLRALWKKIICKKT
ncbi:hypothetical protein [Halomonas huangheensis]|uniref:Uncharacterized protein n=1 Tax=Halomonas huangheensis TaxID=1178482 RepID=W1N1K5_9GAMM|nr:hypothetical protein [Halomonas huangheensis]ALM52258.1 hypothetical protein AR456_08130 [Halomonas huangheensis]ERL49482.1 hypothetical protein BJB45_06795 [Halomonas huangheensis]